MWRTCVGLLALAGCGRLGFGSSSSTTRDGALDAVDGIGGDAPAAVCHTGTWGTPVPIASTQTGSEEADPSISVDELTLWFESNRSPSQGRALWMATRPTRADAFGAPTRLVALDDVMDDADPEVTADGLTLYFASRRTTGSQALYVATRAQLTDPFALVGAVTFTNDIDVPRTAPSLSGDGQTLYFGRDLDVALATRTDVSTFAYVRELDEINEPPTDGNPAITADGLELFFDTYRNGPAAIFVATRADTGSPFSAPVELPELTGGFTAAGSPDISSDGRTLYYWINDGSQIDLYTSTRTCD